METMYGIKLAPRRKHLGKVVYAGFRYDISEVNDYLDATPEPGQHPAADKHKHRRAAIEQYMNEHK